jgi:hypothetical protein
MALSTIVSYLALSTLAHAVPLSQSSTSSQEPCAKIAAINGTTVDAELAYQCLQTIPIKNDVAEQLVKALQPYLEFQSTLKTIENPPADYAEHVQKPYSIVGAMDTVLQKVKSGSYKSEYDVSGK